MSKTIFVKPRNKNLKVRDPKTGGRLPASGAEVEDNSYWRRRLRDKDVVIPNPNQTAVKKKAVAKKKATAKK